MNLEDLHNAYIAQAESLDLDVDVISDGPLGAQVAIVGEGLGETEVRQGAPFVGGSGQLLFNSLRQYGLHRANCYTTNVVKRQISLARFGNEKHIVHKDELLKWQGLLQWELEHLPNLRTVFVLGNYALEAITGNSGITNWRGSVVTVKVGNKHSRAVQAVCSINPAYALREPKMEPIFLMDCKKVDLVNRGVFKEHDVETFINPSYKQAMSYLRDLGKAKKPFAYDIEVINMETACHGFSNDPHHGMCINLRGASGHRYTTQEEADIILAIQQVCDSHSAKPIAQNASFDASWTWLHDWLDVNPWFDTLLAHHTLYPQLPHSLAFQVAQYTTHPYYKDEGKFWREGGDIDQFWRYNCKDTALTVAVFEKEQRELESQGLTKFFMDHVMRAQPHLVSATVHGLAVDLEMKKRIVEQSSEDVAKTLAEFHRLAQEAVGVSDYYPNPNSPPQMRELLFSRLRLVGRGQSTDEANREKIMAHHGTSPIAKELITVYNKFKSEDKFLGTYAESKVGRDGRFRCSYNQAGVARAPGRLSSAALLDGQGGNMQNQPPRARAMYIADPGTVFVYFDLKQAEAQVVAVRARIETWMAQFEKMRIDGKYDAHRALASEMFKVEYDMVPKADFQDANGKTNKDPDFDESTAEYTMRYTAKRCRHGLNYRMQAYKLAEVTGLPYHTARKAFALYHSATPELQEWWKQEEKQFKATRTIYNAIGRRWKVIQRLDDDVLSSIIAFYPQSTIGDKITQVWYQAEEDDAWPDAARVCIDVHDNLVALATPKVAKSALSVLKKYAEAPLMLQDAWGGKIIPWSIGAETKMSVPDKDGIHRWSNMKEVEL